MAETPFSTPKRKHAQLVDDHMPDIDTATQFTFDLQTPSSPRTNAIARRFQGLEINGGGGVSGSHSSQSPEPTSMKPGFLPMQEKTQDGARKRVKRLDIELSDTDASQLHLPAAAWDGSFTQAAFQPIEQQGAEERGRKSRSQSPRQKSPRSVKFALDTAVVVQSEALANTGSNNRAGSPSKGAPRTASPSTEPAFEGEGKPRSRVRVGTPPPRSKTDSDATAVTDDPIITDPLRASLTWHDDEITIYDPDDSDDDGTGINGIGFKPTPAIAYARTVKRKQQLAEYRKREEREARAKRSQRRRGSPVPGLVELKGSVERRRVRFMESATELLSF
ncbi:hypothetical protein B0T16DRAFT_408448 [Cercophora newfieldiana]|uniref:Uncharacterized protein n=1 Tax=Cercophora newfieldiana TaxID=92897 RepID=A0AA39Y9M5_9PEZI|nr:hypothetical protein B0T16DRAFT_408448 [Cercophora newfieldiana]